MALPGYSRMDDPLRKVMPKTGLVQNTNSLTPNTAPISSRPPAAPGINTAPPGPVPGQGPFGIKPALMNAGIKAGEPAPGIPPAPLSSPVTPPLGQPPGAIVQPPAPNAPPPMTQPAAPSLYGSGGGGAPSLEDQIRQYITGAMGGVTSKAFIDRAKSQLGSNVEGQRQQAVRRSDEDLIRRGLFKSGLGAEQSAAIGTGAQSALSSGIADILSKAEQQDIAGRESAAGTAGNLLGMNRSWDQYQQQRADEQSARAAANAPRDTTFQYQDPDTGEVYSLDEKWFQ